jgi:hypothetical protein
MYNNTGQDWDRKENHEGNQRIWALKGLRDVALSDAIRGDFDLLAGTPSVLSTPRTLRRSVKTLQQFAA